MTDHIRTMSLYERNFVKLAAGDKTIEIRVAYPNNRRRAAGQLLRFLSGDDLELLTRIVRITEYPTFDAMLDHESPLAIGYTPDTTRPEMLAGLREIFPAHKEALGVLAIELTLDTADS